MFDRLRGLFHVFTVVFLQLGAVVVRRLIDGSGFWKGTRAGGEQTVSYFLTKVSTGDSGYFLTETSHRRFLDGAFPVAGCVETDFQAAPTAGACLQ